MDKMIDVYKKFLYSLVERKTNKIRGFTYNTYQNLEWIRSCYSPQLITWIRYIEMLNDNVRYKNSFKIVQTEQLSFSLKHIICYIYYHYELNTNYTKYMSNCSKNQLIIEPKHKHKRKYWYTYPTQELIDSLDISFKQCTKWLKILIDNKYSYLILNSFDWNLWNVSL